MKTRIFLIVLLLILQANIAFNHEKIGVIDLLSATALHPLMALYDFDLDCFYKLPLGLSPQGWQREMEERKKNSPEKIAELVKIQDVVNKKVLQIDEARRIILTGLSSAPEERAKQEQELGKLSRQLEACQTQLFEIKYKLDFPERSCPTETRELFVRIASETLDELKKTAREEKIDVVLNNSVAYSTPYSSNPQNHAGKGLTFLQSDIFYSFLTGTNEEIGSEPFSTQNIVSWLDSTRHPKFLERLPINPHPLVLQGGIDITEKVVSGLLTKYKIASETMSIISRLIREKVKKR